MSLSGPIHSPWRVARARFLPDGLTFDRQARSRRSRRSYYTIEGVAWAVVLWGELTFAIQPARAGVDAPIY